jgi:hypothetical protein
MDNKRYEYTDSFNFFISFAMSSFSLSLALYAINRTEGKNWMNIIILVLFVFSMVCFALAISYDIKRRHTPKDTRLDDLIKAVKALKPSETPAKAPDLGSITTQIDEYRKLKTDLDNFFEHLSNGNTIKKE